MRAIYAVIFLLAVAPVLAGDTIVQNSGKSVLHKPYYGSRVNFNEDIIAARIHAINDRYRALTDRILALEEARLLREESRHLYLQNRENFIRMRWAIKDENFSRMKDKFSYLNKLESRINSIERAKSLEEKRRKILGVSESYFVFDGKKFRNFDDFKKSEQYTKMLLDSFVREYKRMIDMELEEREKDAALEFMSRYRYPQRWRERDLGFR